MVAWLRSVPITTALLVAAAVLIGWRAPAIRPRARYTADAHEDPGLPLTLDLLAAVLRSGAPPAQALAAVAPVAGKHRADFAQLAASLRLGAEPSRAWAELARTPALADLSAVAARSAQGGIRLAAACESAASEVRRRRRSAVGEAGQRAAVWGILPLGICFLPAFACVGVVPVLVGIARSLPLGTLPR